MGGKCVLVGGGLGGRDWGDSSATSERQERSYQPLLGTQVWVHGGGPAPLWTAGAPGWSRETQTWRLGGSPRSSSTPSPGGTPGLAAATRRTLGHGITCSAGVCRPCAPGEGAWGFVSNLRDPVPPRRSRPLSCSLGERALSLALTALGSEQEGGGGARGQGEAWRRGCWRTGAGGGGGLGGEGGRLEEGLLEEGAWRTVVGDG